MTQTRKERLARAIAAMAHGKTLYAVTPLLGVVDRERREAVYRLLGHEFEDFADSVARLLTEPPKAA